MTQKATARPPRARNLLSFAGTHYSDGGDVAILGIPLDDSFTQPGQRFGPFSVRLASRRILEMGGHDPVWKLSPFRELKITDAGDVSVTNHSTIASYEKITRRAGSICQTGMTVIGIGGTHGVSLPLLRAAAATHGSLSLIHFDSHVDTLDEAWGTKFNHATMFRRAAEEGLIEPKHSIQVGIRGPNFPGLTPDDSRNLGFDVLTAYEALGQRTETIAARICERVGRRKAYLSFDVDVIDPPWAPGTGAPEVHGLSLGFLLGILRDLRSVDFVGFDVAEVSPILESNRLALPGLTALAAANIIFIFLGIIASQRGGRVE